MFTQLITEPIMGAITGYITNHTAIRSLFQPGGMIEKTQEDFAHAAGILLEEQVLTQSVLAEQLQKPEVQEVIEQALMTFFTEELPSALDEMKVSDLPEQGAVTDCMQNLIKRFMESERERMISLVTKHMKNEMLWTEAQCSRFSAQMEKLLLETLREEKIAEALQKGFLAKSGANTLEELGLGSFCDTIVENLAELSRDWPKELAENYEAEIRQRLEETIRTLDLRPVLLEMDEQIQQYSLGQYLNCDAKELAEQLTIFLHSETGQNLIYDVTDGLLKRLQETDFSFGKLIPDSFWEELPPLLQKELPFVLGEFMDWLKENEAELKKALEDAIDEVAAEAGGVKGKVLQTVKENLLGVDLEDSDFFGTLQKLIVEESASKEAMADWIGKLRKFLNEKNVGILLTGLDQKKKIQPIVQKVLTEQIQNLLEKSGEEMLQPVMEWRPGAMHLARYQDDLEKWLVGMFLRKMEKMDFQHILKQQGTRLRNLSLQQILPSDSDPLEVVLEKVVAKSSRHLTEQFREVSPENFLKPLYDGILQAMEENGKSWIEKLEQKITLKETVESFRDSFQRHLPEIQEAVSKEGMHQLEGKLSMLAEDRINQLEKKEMLRLVEDFMGKELKPLNYLGAGMGAAAGATVGVALSASVPASAVLASPLTAASVIAGKLAVFGAVGYGTNCAAVKGLFWPYHPVKGIRQLQGVIPKQKESFSKNMGRLVDHYVLNEDILKQLIRNTQPHWLEFTKTVAGEQNWVGNLFAVLSGQRKYLGEKLLRAIDWEGALDYPKLLADAGRIPLTFLNTSGEDGGKIWNQKLIHMAEKGLQTELQQTIPLTQIFHGDQIWESISNWFREEYMPDWTAGVHQLFRSDRKVEQFVSPDELETARDSLQQYLAGWLKKEETSDRFAKQAEAWLSRKRMHQWLETSSSGWNYHKITVKLENGLMKILYGKEKELTTSVQNMIHGKLGFMQQMGYNMMGGDLLVAKIVTRVIHQKLPAFLNAKEGEMEGIIKHFWLEHIFPILSMIPIQESQLQYSFKGILQHRIIGECFTALTDGAWNLLRKQPVQVFEKWIDVDVLLERANIQFGFQWQLHKEEMLDCWRPFVQSQIEMRLSQITSAQLTRGMTTSFLLSQLLEDGDIADTMQSFWRTFMKKASVTTMDQWVEWDAMSQSLQKILQGILSDQNFKDWVKYKTEVILLDLGTSAREMFTEKNCEAILKPALSAAFETAEIYAVPLLKKMQLADLAERQIMAMDNRRMEEMVWGFASQYLVHIEKRGWLGAVFAIPGIILFFL